MNVMSSTAATELIVLGLGPGEMLLESIRQAVTDRQVTDGVVVSGIGTLKNLRMHYILDTGFPPKDEIVDIVRPLELVSVSGVIADGQPHLHVVVSCGQEEVWAGHLEDGSEVAYLAEVALLKCPDLPMARVLDTDRKIKLLAPRK